MFVLENSQVKIRIHSTGAELTSFYLKKEQREILWQKDPQIWEEQAPLLFPICARVVDDRYRYQGNWYPMEIHGFTRTSSFALVEQKKDFLHLQLRENTETLKKYPFAFSLDIFYLLKGPTLTQRVKVTNRDPKELLFNVGFHPGFLLPFQGVKSDSQDYWITFEQAEPKAVHLLQQDNILTGERHPFPVSEKGIPYKRNTLEPSLTLTHLTSTYVDLHQVGKKGRIRTHFGNIPYVTFWSPPGHSGFICVEPWHGTASPHNILDLAHKPDIQTLEPDASFETELAIQWVAE